MCVLSQDGGGIYVESFSRAMLTGTVFDSCIAKENGGALNVIDADLTSLNNLTFQNNTGVSGSGGAIYLSSSTKRSLVLNNSIFENNRCGSRGGALLMDLSEDTPSVSCTYCTQPDDPQHIVCWYAENGTWREWNCSSEMELNNCTFHRNSAKESGGAVAATTGRITMRNSVLSGNTATYLGGAIFIGRSAVEVTAALVLYGVSLNDNRASSGTEVYSESGNTLSFAGGTLFHSVTESTGFVIDQGGRFIFNETSGLRCQEGYVLFKMTVDPYETTPFPQWSNSDLCPDPTSNDLAGDYPPYLAQSITLGCSACPLNTYSLDSASLISSQEQDITCRECPYGGNCSRGANDIRAQSGFWGTMNEYDPGSIEFTACPSGYCCDTTRSCVTYATCVGHRTGPLCGNCESGYSAAFISTACLENDRCLIPVQDPAEMLLTCVVVAMVSFVYALYLYYGSAASFADETNIVLYWAQMSAVVFSTADSYDDVEANALSAIQFAFSVIRIDVSGGSTSSDTGLCLYQGATTVQVLAFNYMTPLLIAFAVIALHKTQQNEASRVPTSIPSSTTARWAVICLLAPLILLHMAFCATVREVHTAFCGTDPESDIRQEGSQIQIETDTFYAALGEDDSTNTSDKDEEPKGDDPQETPRLLNALVSLFFLAFSTLVSTTASLVACQNINGMEDPRLFVQAELKCYTLATWWQIPLIFLLALIVMLLLVPPLLEFGYASVSESWSKVRGEMDEQLTMSIAPGMESQGDSDSSQASENQQPTDEQLGVHEQCVNVLSTTVDSISRMGDSSEIIREMKSVMRAPFRKGCVTWGCILALHRLALVAVSATPWSSTVRLICMLFICITACCIHDIARPFKKSAANTLQSTLLYLLAIVCGLQVPATAIQVVAMEIQSSNALLEISRVCLWISAMLMLFVGVLVASCFMYLKKDDIAGVVTHAIQRLRWFRNWFLGAESDLCAFLRERTSSCLRLFRRHGNYRPFRHNSSHGRD